MTPAGEGEVCLVKTNATRKSGIYTLHLFCELNVNIMIDQNRVNAAIFDMIAEIRIGLRTAENQTSSQKDVPFLDQIRKEKSAMSVQYCDDFPELKQLLFP
jgi:hypothetical protein